MRSYYLSKELGLDPHRAAILLKEIIKQSAWLTEKNAAAAAIRVVDALLQQKDAVFIPRNDFTRYGQKMDFGYGFSLSEADMQKNDGQCPCQFPEKEYAEDEELILFHSTLSLLDTFHKAASAIRKKCLGQVPRVEESDLELLPHLLITDQLADRVKALQDGLKKKEAGQKANILGYFSFALTEVLKCQASRQLLAHSMATTLNEAKFIDQVRFAATANGGSFYIHFDNTRPPAVRIRGEVGILARRTDQLLKSGPFKDLRML